VRNQFWPFTGVLRETQLVVTRKLGMKIKLERLSVGTSAVRESRRIPGLALQLSSEILIPRHDQRPVLVRPAKEAILSVQSTWKPSPSARERRPAFAKATARLPEQHTTLGQEN
jgi:hypothetical protein